MGYEGLIGNAILGMGANNPKLCEGESRLLSYSVLAGNSQEIKDILIAHGMITEEKLSEALSSAKEMPVKIKITKSFLDNYKKHMID